MWTWIVQNAAVVQAVVGLVTAAVWITYLQVFVESMRRGRRSEILITLAGDRSLSGRVLVSNLGLEPVYVLDILLTVHSELGHHVLSVADRTEVDPAQVTSTRQATLQQPLKSGEYVEIGTIDILLHRAGRHLSAERRDRDLTGIEITVAAVTAAASGIVAARRVFDIDRAQDRITLRPRTLYAEQIRRRRGRQRIERQLAGMM